MSKEQRAAVKKTLMYMATQPNCSAACHLIGENATVWVQPSLKVSEGEIMNEKSFLVYVEGGKGRRKLFTYLFSYIVDFCPTPPPSTGINDEEFLLIYHKFN